MTRVVTTRLWNRLTPLERLLYSDNPLIGYLVLKLYPDIGNDSYDSWGLDDFVAYGLEQAAMRDWVTYPAVAYWCRREIWKRRKAGDKYKLNGGNDWIETVDVPETPPTHLASEVIDWLELNLPAEIAEGLVLVAEQDLTFSEVCGMLDLDMNVASRSLRRLRQLIREENDE